jgi:hypothetical protein
MKVGGGQRERERGVREHEKYLFIRKSFFFPLTPMNKIFRAALNQIKRP